MWSHEKKGKLEIPKPVLFFFVAVTVCCVSAGTFGRRKQSRTQKISSSKCDKRKKQIPV